MESRLRCILCLDPALLFVFTIPNVKAQSKASASPITSPSSRFQVDVLGVIGRLTIVS